MMGISPRPPLTPEERAATKKWLEIWAETGPLLEAERWNRLLAMSEAEVQTATRQVWELWQPDWPTDEGEGLLLIQRAFARARRTR
jgi:hypothetical protein